ISHTSVLFVLDVSEDQSTSDAVSRPLQPRVRVNEPGDFDWTWAGLRTPRWAEVWMIVSGPIAIASSVTPARARARHCEQDRLTFHHRSRRTACWSTPSAAGPSTHPSNTRQWVEDPGSWTPCARHASFQLRKMPHQ